MILEKVFSLLTTYLMLEHDSVYEQSSDVLLSAMKLQIQQQGIINFEKCSYQYHQCI